MSHVAPTLPRDPSPPWRTPTVVAICESIRQTGDYAGGCPILADALQDADFPDDALLTALRDPNADRVVREVVVAVAYSAKAEDAVRWLADFAAKCGRTCLNYDRFYGFAPGGNYALGTRYTTREEPVYRDITLGTVIQAGHDYHDRGDYFIQVGSEAARDMMSDKNTREAYWRNWSLVTGRTVRFHDDDYDGSAPFACSC